MKFFNSKNKSLQYDFEKKKIFFKNLKINLLLEQL